MKFRCLLPLAAAALTACNPHITIDQAKPITININGHFDVVVHDARQNVESIAGEKPINTVRPEDIGLAPPTAAPIAPPARPGAAIPREEDTYFISLATRTHPAAQPLVPIATVDELTKSMAARHAQVRALWDGKLVGEAHTGLLEPRAALTPAQQQLVTAENADRTALYALDAAQKNTPVADVALGYLLGYLGYAKPGNWYEKRNPSGQWEWKQWGM